MRTVLKRAPQSTSGAAASGPSTDAAGLQATVSQLEAKLAAVTERERDYRRAVTRLEDELKAAGVLQRAFLPTRAPVMNGLDVRVLFRPCTDVSGDAYDIYRIDDTHVAFALADATGHGVSAALLSTLIRNTLRDSPNGTSGRGVPCPGRVLRCVNEELAALGLDDCQFVASLHAVFDERTGIVRLARGGTPFSVVLRDGHAPRVIASDGPIVGAVPDATFEVVEFLLEPGDRLLLYSDGVEPLIGAKSDTASVARAWASIIGGTEPGRVSLSTDALFERLENAIDNGAAADDVTLLAIERTS